MRGQGGDLGPIDRAAQGMAPEEESEEEEPTDSDVDGDSPAARRLPRRVR